MQACDPVTSQDEAGGLQALDQPVTLVSLSKTASKKRVGDQASNKVPTSVCKAPGSGYTTTKNNKKCTCLHIFLN